MLDLKASMQEIARQMNAKFQEVNADVYLLDVPFKMKDGSFRYQYVYGRLARERAKGKDCFYFSSRCGTLTDATNRYGLLVEAQYGVYTMITCVSDKTADGSPCETVIVQASPVSAFVQSLDELYSIIWEVAEVADIVEEKFFGGDKN